MDLEKGEMGTSQETTAIKQWGSNRKSGRRHGEEKVLCLSHPLERCLLRN